MGLRDVKIRTHEHPPITEDTVGGIETKLMKDGNGNRYWSTFIGFGEKGNYGYNGNHKVNICYPSDNYFPFWDWQLKGLTLQELCQNLMGKFDGKIDYKLTMVDDYSEERLTQLEKQLESFTGLTLLEWFALDSKTQWEIESEC